MLEGLQQEDYLRLRCALCRFFEWNGVSDPANLTDEVFYRYLTSTKPDIKDWRAFVHGIAKNVLMEHRREKQREKALKINPIVAPPISPRSDDTTDKLNSCLECLSEYDRSLILGFYHHQDGLKAAATRAKLARRRGLSYNALLIRVSRIRAALAACLKQGDATKPGNEMYSPISAQRVEKSDCQPLTYGTRIRDLSATCLAKRVQRSARRSSSGT